MKIVKHVSLLRVGTSSGYMPKRGIAGSSSSTMSNFLRNLQTEFQSGYTSLQSHQQWRILAQKLRKPKIQFAKHMKLKKKEDQIVENLILLRRGNKHSWKEIQRYKQRTQNRRISNGQALKDRFKVLSD